MDIREAIDFVVSGDDLPMDDAASVMRQIMSGEATPAQLGSFLTALRLKGETTVESAMERLYVLYKIEQGIEQADRGQVVSQEEVKRRMEQWLK